MKTAIEYLQALEEELKYLPSKEVRSIIRIYQEKINNALDYGESIEKILKGLPQPADVAKGIYDSKKVNYLDKKRKEYRRKEIINSTTSLILCIIVTLVFIGIIGYLGIVSFGMLEIIPKFASQDKIIMSGFVIGYLLVMILIMIYLTDLGLMIITFLLSKFLKVFEKIKIDYDVLQDFSITGLIDKITKKKNVVGKILLVSVAIVFVFGATSLIGKGYLSRSFSDVVSTKNEEIIKVDDHINSIKLENTNAKVYIKEGTEFRIIKNSEFDRHFEIVSKDNELEIKFDQHRNYDFLGLLNEPTIVITIEIPQEVAKNVFVKLNSGQIGLDSTNVNKLEVEMQSGDIALKDTKINDFSFKTKDGEINSNGGNYDKVLLDIENGRFASSEDSYNEATINNGSGQISIKDNKFNVLNLKNISGTTVIQKSQINTYAYEAVASILTMSEIKSQYFNITALNASQITLTDLTANLYTFDLNTGFVNASKITGNVNIVKSASNMTFSELVGDIKGQIANSKLSLYNSKLEQLKLELTNCNLDIDDVTINNVNFVCNKVQAILIDLYFSNMDLELNASNLQYYNNSSNPVGSIKIKNVASQYSIDSTVKYGELKEE